MNHELAVFLSEMRYQDLDQFSELVIEVVTSDNSPDYDSPRYLAKSILSLAEESIKIIPKNTNER